eukprot:m.385626 g.385626  ORF g.385626 m.385626 type:complete len:261 (+) comp16741_c0_seq2:806-1588(+)
MLVLIKAEAINDLNTKQEQLPSPSKKHTEVEAAKVQLAEMTWEYEVIVCREHLAESRLKALVPIAEARRADEKAQNSAKVKDMEELRKKDLAAIEARKKAMDSKMDEIRRAREQAAAEEKQRRDEELARRRAEAEERRKQAQAFKAKLAQESEAMTLAEQKRREQAEEDRRYAALDEQRQAERKAQQERDRIAKEEAEEEARQRDAALLFGGKKKKAPPPLRADQFGGGGGEHPMLAMMAGIKVAPGSRTHLCDPPNTRM